MDATNQAKDDDRRLAGDILVGAAAIKAFLVHDVGMPETVDPYYLRRVERGWPIGSDGGRLIASKRRLSNHAQKLAARVAAE